MWHGLRLFLRIPVVWIPLAVAGLFNIASWFLLLRHAVLKDGGDVIVLHYSKYYGVDLVGKWLEAFYIPLIGVCLILLNIGIAYTFRRRSQVVSKLFLYFTPVLQLLIFFAVFFIIIVNLPIDV